jgi:hypothetical protein
MSDIGIRPRAGKIADAVTYSGFSRSTLYLLAPQKSRLVSQAHRYAQAASVGPP